MEKPPANGSDPFQTCNVDPPKAATPCKPAKASSRGRRPFVSIKLLAAKGRGLGLRLLRRPSHRREADREAAVELPPQQAVHDEEGAAAMVRSRWPGSVRQPQDGLQKKTAREAIRLTSQSRITGLMRVEIYT